MGNHDPIHVPQRDFTEAFPYYGEFFCQIHETKIAFWNN
jgi:hypothetical protein